MNNLFKYIIILGLTIFYSCEDMYEPQKEYIDCSWFQYAEQQIFNCEDVSWCDESQFPNEKVRLAWIFYTGNKPDLSSQFYYSDTVDRIFYYSYQSECISYYRDNNEIICNVIDQGVMTKNISGYITAFMNR